MPGMFQNQQRDDDMGEILKGRLGSYRTFLALWLVL